MSSVTYFAVLASNCSRIWAALTLSLIFFLRSLLSRRRTALSLCTKATPLSMVSSSSGSNSLGLGTRFLARRRLKASILSASSSSSESDDSKLMSPLTSSTSTSPISLKSSTSLTDEINGSMWSGAKLLALRRSLPPLPPLPLLLPVMSSVTYFAVLASNCSRIWAALTLSLIFFLRSLLSRRRTALSLCTKATPLSMVSSSSGSNSLGLGTRFLARRRLKASILSASSSSSESDISKLLSTSLFSCSLSLDRSDGLIWLIEISL